MKASLAIFSFFLFVLAQVAPAAERYTNLDVQQFEKLRADTNNVVLDVRTKKEFDAGHIAGATNIDVNAPDFDQKVAKLDKNKTYLVHCAAGKRSARACEKLGTMDFKKLYNLEGGYTAWEKSGNKGEKPSSAK